MSNITRRGLEQDDLQGFDADEPGVRLGRDDVHVLLGDGTKEVLGGDTAYVLAQAFEEMQSYYEGIIKDARQETEAVAERAAIVSAALDNVMQRLSDAHEGAPIEEVVDTRQSPPLEIAGTIGIDQSANGTARVYRRAA